MIEELTFLRIQNHRLAKPTYNDADFDLQDDVGDDGRREAHQPQHVSPPMEESMSS